MKTQRIDNSKEMLILTGMITDTVFLKKVQPILNTKLFKSKPAKIIAKWCIEYYKDNESCPNVHIQDIYDDYISKSDNKEQILLIGKVLQNLSKKFDRAKNFNTDYVLSIAEKFFSSEYLKIRCEQILDVIKEDPKKAAELMQDARIPQLPSTQGHDVYKSPELLQEALEDSRTPLFRMPGALGELINEDLCRGSLMGFMGPEKRGKSWILMELAYKASLARLNVVLVQAGDMMDLQMMRRLSIRMCKKSNMERYCEEMLVPVYDCKHNQDNSCKKSNRTGRRGLDIYGEDQNFLDAVADKKMKMEFFEEHRRYKACDECRRHRKKSYRYGYAGAIWYKIKEKTEPLSVSEALKELTKHDKRTGKGGFKLISYPNKTLTVDMIEAHVLAWNEELFITDVIVVDYADILISGTTMEERHKQNHVWMGLRSLSQKFNCLVITATQTDADSYKLHTITLNNFTEDKRKFGHVTSMYSLNKTDAEKAAGLMRIACILGRDDEFDSRRQVKVMQNLQDGRAHVGSYW